MTEETHKPHSSDDNMSKVTPGSNEDQACDPNPGRKTDANEGQTPERSTRVSPVQKQMRHEDKATENVKNHIIHQ